MEIKLKFSCLLLSLLLVLSTIIFIPKDKAYAIDENEEMFCDICGIKSSDPYNEPAILDCKTELYEMWTHETGGSEKKTYMDYFAITDKNSKQYKFQQRDDVCVDERGFLVQNATWYVVAMGSYWGDIGDKFVVYLDSGKIISVVIGDIKADRHTDSNNYAHATDGHVLEFIIDSRNANMQKVGIKHIGLVNKAFPEFDGKIVHILKVVETFE